MEKPILKIQDHTEKWTACGFSSDCVGFRSPLLESDHNRVQEAHGFLDNAWGMIAFLLESYHTK